jgi:GntR family transcriptional regulator, transcriptional repressor for pyruvate dehydrogenase complex
MSQLRSARSDLTAGTRMPAPRQVVDHLQQMILRGGLKPGDRLPSQRELSLQLGVSRPSLREAMSVLETMGLITIRVGSGAYVAAPEDRAPLWRFSDRCSPRDVYEARYGLESYAAKLAARTVDSAGVARLAACVKDMRLALHNQDIGGMAAADAQFHDLLFELCGNPVLAGMYRPVRDLMVETQRLPMIRWTRLEETLSEHEDLLATIAAKDAPAAEVAMQGHIRSAAKRFDIEI